MEADDGVGAYLHGMLDHQIVGLLASLLAHLGVGADAPSDNALQSSQDTLGDGGRAHDDAAHNSLVFSDAVTVNVQGCGDGDAHYALRTGCWKKVFVMLSAAKHLHYFLENKELQILRFAQDDVI